MVAMKVVVLGAGIVGMTSALRIVEDCGTAGLDMTVMADKFSPNTTSDVAAGNAEILNVKTGLRPMREMIRLEKEEKKDNLSGKTVQIIHNYGHGGNGIAWSFGCAKEVAIMVKQLLQKQSTKSRL
ncbi:DAO [Branchiostoma lanceolatum]|uniref:DAO protein n=1 Tax=Branchiostoma lanceolatum TaxID=7740 RepID=A0A8J9YU59_BRALA|nr:DAO [Branchiostoma lanceolatum]